MRLTRGAEAAGLIALIGLLGSAATAAGQDTAAAEPGTRTAVIEQAIKQKSNTLVEYKPNKVEEAIDRAEDLFLTGRVHWHPFFDSAYAGGGFTLGAGYITHVSSYNTFDVRGSYTRLEAQFVAPRLFDRRGRLSLLGGWREATQVGFYGIGTDNTSKDDRANYNFEQPYADATLDVWPTRRYLQLTGGV